MAQATKRTSTSRDRNDYKPGVLLSGNVHLPTVLTADLISLLDLAWSFSEVATGIANRPRNADSEIFGKLADDADGFVDQVAEELAGREVTDEYEAEQVIKARLRYLSRIGAFAEVAALASRFALPIRTRLDG